jgi:hypothetical protein
MKSTPEQLLLDWLRARLSVDCGEAPLPDLWLEGCENEQLVVADCGCMLYRDYQDSGDPAFFYCEAHRKALDKKRKTE